MSCSASLNQEASKPCRKKTHFVSPSCRAEHPGNKKPANHAEGKNTIFVSPTCRAQHPGSKKPANRADTKTTHFVRPTCRHQHRSNKKPAKNAEKNAILLRLVVVLNILETGSQQRMQKKTAPFCYGWLSCSTSWKTRSQQTMQQQQPHFVSASCRAQHPGNKKPASHAEKTAPFC